ncbi:2-C-methyl-D-erythritol 4-phosphate cytidylyltransferase [Conexibacter sp. JD483]|uniref:2-C-methyl-D-erythritol 4-phosphate cytidylyltransferase n=1 Tax=unclassified Conexibacter TaxID=2627773 RepID=UPI00271B43A2|nr:MULTISPECIES: 2-C-methyl-D-erythritol 4-phosphate cytidylyltransferase [unclassified Conexibacter]MDO8189057.1 2-C-methyl-D-erythritol 4-phosphate cytidylyltransferase [Conexibacter sp. CPCC 205706]MDO8201324.1 2-C-methyl-D-erythritol 4-phosphate cytidylyltransferase [Conexibacter sp. CPCC 205762]MDR9371670.1 2-C-methyl-D-erythritol 4-phosphate cytidylyltransferase [Conexibacter sp. JD483]
MAVALLVAAGRGERLGAAGPKAFVMLAGRPMLEWSLDALRSVPAVERIVVALPAGEQAPAGTVGVAGGAERSHSVRAALAAAGDGPDDEAIVVHDAARPLLTPEIVQASLDALDHTGADAVVAAAPVVDTIKRVHADAPGLHVEATLDRSALWAVQTPQVFRRAALRRALALPDAVLAAATDDAGIVEQTGGRVHLVESPRENLKVTNPLDLRLAALLLEERC